MQEQIRAINRVVIQQVGEVATRSFNTLSKALANNPTVQISGDKHIASLLHSMKTITGLVAQPTRVF